MARNSYSRTAFAFTIVFRLKNTLAGNRLEPIMGTIYLIQFIGAILALAVIFGPLAVALRSMHHDKMKEIENSRVVNTGVNIPA
jgi:hypothetical protein